eukprot:CAMPEP_0115179202 /NCGR_PEP_ID=MMETSP0270-20121206/6290_1 /TAXON_ID=71861 /ORGANISM="Scrippsiella trochoidea, Strain CCMP3099" /LENGTH=442 /DNA_ID=CAMNT_0002592179 /DNA_START=17 /DNA_END=1341 /DNA_ORIENTATION=+
MASAPDRTESQDTAAADKEEKEEREEEDEDMEEEGEYQQPSPMDVGPVCMSPRSPRPSVPSRRNFGSARGVPQSPVTPCTPVKPVWQMRCEEACQRCPYPTHFALKQSSKGEDRLTMDVRPGGNGETVWAVFDGHRSHDVAGHAARIVPGLVWQSDYWPNSPGEALRSALCEANESARKEELRGGSTAIVVASTGDSIWCCNAGDSRAVVALRGGGVHRLSVDHTTSCPEEVSRIQAAGGTVEWGCVGGQLPMTRGLGNFCLEADGFACLPQVTSVLRSEAEFVVIASDGLWDVVSDDQCCAFVRQWGGAGVAEHLVNKARSLGSSDDIAIVVAFFPQQTAMDVGCPSPPAPRFNMHQPSLVSIPSNGSFGEFCNFGNFGAFGSPHWRPPPVVRPLPFSTALGSATVNPGEVSGCGTMRCRPPPTHTLRDLPLGAALEAATG